MKPNKLCELAKKLGARGVRTPENGDTLAKADTSDAWYTKEQINPKNPSTRYGTIRR